MSVTMTEEDVGEYHAKVAELATNLQLSRSQLEQRQLDKFRRLVAYARARSPYYRDVIAKYAIDVASCHPGDFPVLTKSDILDNFDRIVTQPAITRRRVEDFLRVSKDPFELFDGRYFVIASSGTSGQPGITLCSVKEYLEGTAQTTRLLPKLPENLPRKIRVAFVGAIDGHFAGVTMFAGFRTRPDSSRYDTRLVDIHRPWREVARALSDFQPDIVVAYTSALRDLADYQESGQLAISPRAVSGIAEMMSPADRVVIDRAFKVSVTNMYASTECMYMGCSKTGNEMTLFEDDLIFDRREDHTRITNLFNYTLPMINYRMNDILAGGALASDPFMRVKELVGRREANLTLENRDGQPEWISAVALALLHAPGVRRFQFVAHGRRQFTCKMCFDATLDESGKQHAMQIIGDELRGMLTKKRMDNVQFDVTEVAEIAKDERTGKFRFVVIE
jgi:phenylacetate-CoA ligase